MKERRISAADLKNLALTEEEFQRIAIKFRNKMLPYLKKNRKKIFTLKGSPEIPGISQNYGPYVGKNHALYISKNPAKSKLKDVKLNKFYLDLEKKLSEKFGNKIFWRSNIILDQKTSNVVEIEFIPMAFKGNFLLNILKKDRVKMPDSFGLIHAAVVEVGKILHELILDEGYQSTYPTYISNFENMNQDSFDNEIENADFYVDLQFTEKKIFTSKEIELMEKYSESSLELKIGLELVKEAIPFVIQYEIKDDFPRQKSKKIIAKPEFIILDPYDPIAIYCDSYRYHQRKKDQILKDKRIDRKLQRHGFKVYRFSETEIVNNIESCIEEIKAQYFGAQHALSPNEALLKKILKINQEEITDFEKEFIISLSKRLNEGKVISLKEEKILQDIFHKFSNKNKSKV